METSIYVKKCAMLNKRAFTSLSICEMKNEKNNVKRVEKLDTSIFHELEVK